MVINYYMVIITLNKNILKLVKNNIQEDSINLEIDAHNHPNRGVLTLASLDAVILVFSWL